MTERILGQPTAPEIEWHRPPERETDPFCCVEVPDLMPQANPSSDEISTVVFVVLLVAVLLVAILVDWRGK